MNEVNCLKIPPFALMQQDFAADGSSLWGDRSLGQQSFRIRPFGMQPYRDKLGGWGGFVPRMPPLEDPSKDLAIDNQPVRALPIFLHYEQVVLMNSWKYRHTTSDDWVGTPSVTRGFRQPTNYFGKPGTVLRLPKTVIVPAARFEKIDPETGNEIGQYAIFDRVASALGSAFDRESIFMCLQWSDNVPLTDYRYFPYNTQTYPDYNFTTNGDVNGPMYPNPLLTGLPWCDFQHYYSGFPGNHRFIKMVDGSQFVGGDLLVLQAIENVAFSVLNDLPNVEKVTTDQYHNGATAFRRYRQVIYPFSPGTDIDRVAAACDPPVSVIRVPPFLPLDVFDEGTWIDAADNTIIPEIQQFFNL